MDRQGGRIRGRVKKKNIPVALCALCLSFVWNGLIYYTARQLAAPWPHHDLTTALDRQIPFLPWTVSVYFGAYLFWFVNYSLCALGDEVRRDRFFCADFMAKTVCFVLFLALPTANVRPEVTGDGLWSALMRLLYRLDAADNLFPSIHCLTSWLSWIAVRKRQDIPCAYRIASLIAAVAICFSTLTTRQHVLVDVFGGIALAEGCYALAAKEEVYSVYSRTLRWLLDNPYRKSERDRPGS